METAYADTTQHDAALRYAAILKKSVVTEKWKDLVKYYKLWVELSNKSGIGRGTDGSFSVDVWRSLNADRHVNRKFPEAWRKCCRARPRRTQMRLA